MTIQDCLDLFYVNKDIKGCLKALKAIDKLWHLDDNVSDCFSDKETIELLTKFQDDLFAYAVANSISPWSYWPWDNEELLDAQLAANESLLQVNSVYRIALVNEQFYLAVVSDPNKPISNEPISYDELLDYIDELIADEKSCL